jgi:hypothetical protein
MSGQIVTANRLSDGAVVYLTPRGGWSEDIADGRVADGEYEIKDLMAWAQGAADRNEVVGPYPMGIGPERGRGRALGMRESIRAAGPTVETRA